MKILNRKRVLSFLLSLAMFVSLIPSSAFTIFAADEVGSSSTSTESESAKNEFEANVGKQAVFDWWSDFLLIDTDTLMNSTADEMYDYYYANDFENWVLFDQAYDQETGAALDDPYIEANDLILKIEDYHYDSDNGYYWYKVSGNNLPTILQEKPWVLYTKDADIELGQDPYLAIFSADAIIRIRNVPINGIGSVRFVLSGPAALTNATISITDYNEGYPVSALAFTHATNGTWSDAIQVQITKEDGSAWTSSDGEVGILYTAQRIATDTYEEDVCYGAAFLYIDNTVYSANVTDKMGYDASDTVYTNAGTSVIVYEIMPEDFLELNYKGFYTTEQVNVYNNTLSAYTTITATESVKVLYSFTQLIYTQVEKEVEKTDEAGNPVVDENGDPVMETVVETVVDQQIPWYWIESDGQYLFVRQESITFESEEVIDTKFVFKPWVVEVDVYSDPEMAPNDYELVDITLFDGVYKVSGSYYDEEYQMLFYRLECCEHFTWPEGYEEYRYVDASLLEETDRGIAHPIVDFTNPAPIFETPSISPFMLRSAPGAALAAYGLTRAATSGNGLEMSKDVKDNGNGTYTVTLEAYTTGTVTVTQTTKPMDIVLVLDQSGSMAYCIGCGYSNSSYHAVDSEDVVTTGTYYYRTGSSGGGGYPGGGYPGGGYTYTQLYYCSTCGSWHTSNTHSGNSYTTSNTTFYEACTSRVDALKAAVTAFVTEVNEKAKGPDGVYGTTDDVKHRIAIVGFASESGNGNNTEILSVSGSNSGSVGAAYNSLNTTHYQSALQDVTTDTGRTMLTNAINALATSGATRSDLGMEIAENIYANNALQDDRNRITIMFTDGTPTTQSNFSTTVAENAISSAYTQKNTYGATVYTVGVFDGADASNPKTLPTYTDSGSNRENRYMHLVSSNYPNATGIDDNEVGSINELVSDTQSYYMSASSTEALSKIFVAMSSQVGSTPMPLDSSTMVKDIITPQFTLPANATDVAVKQVDCLTYNATTGEATWGTETALPSDTVDINEDTHSVDVTGFDFAHNYVAEIGRDENDDEKEGTFKGRKLVITFTISPDPDFLGGSDAATNDPDSGIYKKNEDGSYTCVGNFIPGSADVPLKEISTVVQNKYIYYGNTVNLTDILNLYVKRDDQNTDLRITVDGVNNAYVDLQYTITLNDSTVAVYTIPAGKAWDEGTWTKNQGELLQNFAATGETSFTVNCVMTDAGDSSKSSPASGTAYVFVYKPTLTFMDSVQEYNKPLAPTATDVNSFLSGHYVGVQWNLEASPNRPADYADYAIDGTEPTFTFTFNDVGNAFEGMVMKSVRDVPIVVTVTVYGTEAYGGNATSVTGNTYITFAHQDCDPDCGFDPSTEQFIVHVIGALTSLTIQKSGWYIADPNQTFLFNITGKDADGNNIDLTVTVHEDGSVTIYGLVIGNTYTITEDVNWSWRYNCTGWEYSDGTAGSGNEASITIVENGTITFTNSRNVDKWLDGDAWCDNLFNLVTTVKDDEE